MTNTVVMFAKTSTQQKYSHQWEKMTAAWGSKHPPKSWTQKARLECQEVVFHRDNNWLCFLSLFPLQPRTTMLQLKFSSPIVVMGTWMAKTKMQSCLLNRLSRMVQISNVELLATLSASKVSGKLWKVKNWPQSLSTKAEAPARQIKCMQTVAADLNETRCKEFQTAISSLAIWWSDF